MSSANFTGHLGLRSSPLSPISSKLSTQMMVISHMENHYKKISKVKCAIFYEEHIAMEHAPLLAMLPTVRLLNILDYLVSAVDHGLPKSMLASQKMRDRYSRMYNEKMLSRPGSRQSHVNNTAAIADALNDEQLEDPQDEQECQVREIMHTTLGYPMMYQHDGDVSREAAYGSSPYSTDFLDTNSKHNCSATMKSIALELRGGFHNGRTRPVSARSSISMDIVASRGSHASNPLRITYDGDVLKTHSRFFTQPSKPFFPRTLKSNRESCLKRYKYYTPPPLNESNHLSVSPRSAKHLPGNDAQKSEVNGRQLLRSCSTGDIANTEELTEAKLMDMTLQSNGTKRQENGGDGFDLRMPVDENHLKWMEDQASRAKVRARNGVQSRKTVNGRRAKRNMVDNLIVKPQKLHDTDCAPCFSTVNHDECYVVFAKDITEDICSRGITSDRVLSQIFERHIQGRKGELNEVRMRKIISKIRHDLGVTSDDAVSLIPVVKEDNDHQVIKTSPLYQHALGITNKDTEVSNDELVNDQPQYEDNAMSHPVSINGADNAVPPLPSVGDMQVCHISIPSKDATDVDDCQVSVPSKDTIHRHDCQVSVPSKDVIDRHDCQVSVPSKDVIDRHDCQVSVPSKDVIDRHDCQVSVPSKDATGRHGCQVLVPNKDATDRHGYQVSVPSKGVIDRHVCQVSVSNKGATDGHALSVDIEDITEFRVNAGSVPISSSSNYVVSHSTVPISDGVRLRPVRPPRRIDCANIYSCTRSISEEYYNVVSGSNTAEDEGMKIE